MPSHLLRRQPFSSPAKNPLLCRLRFKIGVNTTRLSSTVSSPYLQAIRTEKRDPPKLSSQNLSKMRTTDKRDGCRRRQNTQTATASRSLKRMLVASIPYYYYWHNANICSRVEGFAIRSTQSVRTIGVRRSFSFLWKQNCSYRPSFVRFVSSSIDVTNTANDKEGLPRKEDENDTFATSYHAPVMVNECLDALLDCERGTIRNPHPKSYKTRNKKKKKKHKEPPRDTIQEPGTMNDATVDSESHPPLIFVDGTLGGGGHSNALLQRLRPGDILFGCDVDPNALKTASERLAEYINHDGSERPLFIPVESNFGDLAENLPKVVHPINQERILGSASGVDGILLDLGVSSHQLDEAERGFSFMRDGPLDMRMGSANGVDGLNNSGLTAADICNEFDQAELQRIFSVYGDEPRAKTVAKAIVDHRPLETTGDLAMAIASVTPKFAKNKRHGKTATCARVFQSLRIVVNNEDGVLARVLSEACPSLLRAGGRLVVMSYHSMEDRATKRIMRDGTLDVVRSSRPEKDIYGNDLGPAKPFRPIQKRRKATPEETERNPRARSAVLRVAERLDTIHPLK